MPDFDLLSDESFLVRTANGPSAPFIAKIRHPLIFRTVGPVLPKVGPSDILYAQTQEHFPLDARSQGSAFLMRAMPYGIPSAPATAYPQVFVRGPEDILSQPRNPDSFILGGQPNRETTPRSLRSTVIGRPPDETLATDPLFPGAAQLQGGDPNTPITPRTLRTIIANVAEDVFSNPKHPEGTVFGGKPSKEVTPRSLRPVVIQPAEDVLSLQRHPEGKMLGTQPSRSITPSSLRPTLIQPSEDILTDKKHPEGTVWGGKPVPAPVVAPSPPLKPLVATADELSDWLVLEGKAQVWRTNAYGVSILPSPPTQPLLASAEDPLSTFLWPLNLAFGGKPSQAVTPQSLRPLLLYVPQEDVLTAEKWPPSQILGGKPRTSVTPTGIRSPLIVPQEDVLSSWKWPLVQQFGGRPVGVITPRSLRPVLTVLQNVDDTLRFLQDNPTRLYRHNLLAFGQALSVVTRGLGQFSRTRFAVTAGFLSQASAGFRPSFLSLQMPWQELLLGEENKSKIARITPRIIFPSPPKTFQIASVDPFLIVQHETPTRILGGKPSRGVTPRTLRDIVYNFGEDNYFFVDYAPSVSAGNQNRPKSPTPPAPKPPGPMVRPFVSKIRNPYVSGIVGPSTPATGVRPLLFPSNPYDADCILNALYHGKGTVLGGRPSRSATMPTLRNVLHAAPPDESILFNLYSKGIHWLWQGTAIVAFTPPSLRTPLYVPVEDVSQYQLWPPSQKLGGQPNVQVTPVSKAIARMVTVIPEDIYLPMTNAGDAKILSSPAPGSATQPSLRAILAASTPDLFTPQIGPSLVHWTRSFTAPGILPNIPLAVKIVRAEDVLSALLTPSVVHGGNPSNAVTPPSLREILFNFAEDAFFFTDPSGNSFPPLGGKSSAPITIRTRRTVLIASTPDVLSLQRNPEGTILGGRPNRAITPFTLRRPLLAFVEDVLSLPRNPEGIILGGKPNRDVTPRTLRSPILVLAEDTLSLQRHPESYRFGGLSTFRITTPSLRPVTVIHAEDALSLQRHPEATILGGRPNRPVTPPTLRQLLTVPAEAVLAELMQSQSLSGGIGTKPFTAPTLRSVMILTAEDIFSLQNHPYAWVLGGKFGTVPVIGGISVWGWIPPPREIAWRVPGEEIAWIIDSESQWEPPTE